MTKILLPSSLDELASYVDEATLERIRTGQVERFESLESFMLISFDWYDIEDRLAAPSRLIIYFSKEHLFFVCENKTLFAKMLTLIKDSNENDRTLYLFFSALIKPDMDYLEKLEDDITTLEDKLLTHTKVQCTEHIVLFRKKLLRLKKYYEQLNSIFEDLVENENELICDVHLKYYVVLDNRLDRLFGTVVNLRDLVTQVREAYQAQIDIEQNAIMKVFTVITSIFLPLTLIVGWYGMNLQMPEFSWQLGYPLVIVLSICVCMACVIFFKRKKWF